MNKNKILIFTDLDGSILDRDTFKFDQIKQYMKKILNSGILIIPNSSKTESEIIEFNQELGENLAYISENGSVINGLNLLNSNFPNKIILSREKKELVEIFTNKVPENLQSKCKFISNLNKKDQINIFGLGETKLKYALDRKYTEPFLFEGSKNEKKDLTKILKKNSLTIQEGGRVINLCDNVNNIKVIAVGDNYNDLDMLKNSDLPCLVFNDQFREDQINIDNLIISNRPSPDGWADVVKKALVKLDHNV